SSARSPYRPFRSSPEENVTRSLDSSRGRPIFRASPSPPSPPVCALRATPTKVVLFTRALGDESRRAGNGGAGGGGGRGGLVGKGAAHRARASRPALSRRGGRRRDRRVRLHLAAQGSRLRPRRHRAAGPPRRRPRAAPHRPALRRPRRFP